MVIVMEMFLPVGLPSDLFIGTEGKVRLEIDILESPDVSLDILESLDVDLDVVTAKVSDSIRSPFPFWLVSIFKSTLWLLLGIVTIVTLSDSRPLDTSV